MSEIVLPEEEATIRRTVTAAINTIEDDPHLCDWRCLPSEEDMRTVARALVDMSPAGLNHRILTACLVTYAVRHARREMRDGR